jgi:hypothetical protein
MLLDLMMFAFIMLNLMVLDYLEFGGMEFDDIAHDDAGLNRGKFGEAESQSIMMWKSVDADDRFGDGGLGDVPFDEPKTQGIGCDGFESENTSRYNVRCDNAKQTTVGAMLRLGARCDYVEETIFELILSDAMTSNVMMLGMPACMGILGAC